MNKTSTCREKYKIFRKEDKKRCINCFNTYMHSHLCEHLRRCEFPIRSREEEARAETGPQSLRGSYLVFASAVSGYRKASPRHPGAIGCASLSPSHT